MTITEKISIGFACFLIVMCFIVGLAPCASAQAGGVLPPVWIPWWLWILLFV